MKIGVRAHDYGRHAAWELAKRLYEEGFEAVQLAIPKAIEGIGSYGELTDSKTEPIREAFMEKQLDISVLGCYIDLGQRDTELRMEQIGQFERALYCGRQLSAGMVGTESSYGIIPIEKKKATWNILLDSMERIMEKAEKIGVNVGIEPVAAHTLYCAEWTRRLLEQIGSSRLKVIFDPVNLLTADTISRQEKVWEECFELFGKSIEVIHLKDFIVKENVLKPCLLGEGLMRYDSMFQWLHQEKPDIAVLREEMVPEFADKDIAFMKKLLAPKER